MTLLTTFGITPTHRGNTVAPRELALSDLTMVVPVKNNQTGVTRLLEACLRVFAPNHFPAEILLVDNLSHPPVEVPAHLASYLPIRRLVCARPGAAAARNLGARQAQTQWILFLDSDCLPMPGLIDGYRQAMNGAIAYAGIVQAERSDLVSRYYDAQSILNPSPVWDKGEERPAYLITANALVWREALAQIGGLDERFPSAGGEDIDLGIRLWSLGPLAYAPAAQTLHTFEPHLRPFVHRFVRYGRGNRLLAARYQANLAPHPFVPQLPSLINRLLASVQFFSLWWGYHTTWPARNWSMPSPIPAWSRTTREILPTQEEQSLLQASSEVAVLIDGDNISASRAEEIGQKAVHLGSIAIGYVCCNQPSRRWETASERLPWPLTVEVSEGNVDQVLAMFAERLIHTTSIRRFCLVTNDGDFAVVARRLKEVGTIWGMGETNASGAFRQECDQFHPFSIPMNQQTGQGLKIY